MKTALSVTNIKQLRETKQIELARGEISIFWADAALKSTLLNRSNYVNKFIGALLTILIETSVLFQLAQHLQLQPFFDEDVGLIN